MKHPHHERTEKTIIYTTPVTLAIGTGMVVFLTNPLASLSGIALGTISVSAFALVHCIRANRRRRQRHQRQDLC